MKHSIKKQTNRLMSFFLAVVMIFTSLTITPIVANAEEGTNLTNIKIHFKNDVWNWETPALHVNKEDLVLTVSGNEAPEAQPIEGWDSNGYLLEDEGDGFYSIAIKGDFNYFQLLDLATPSNNTDNICDEEAMPQYNGETPQDLYAIPGDDNKIHWFLDKEGKTALTPPESSVTSTDLTVHFKNEKNWDKVYGKFGSGGSWTPISGLEYCMNGYGGIIEENEKNPGWFSFRVTKQDAKTVNGNFNCGEWDAGKQTDDYEIPITAETMEVWITYEDAASNDKIQVSSEAPSGWVSGATVSAPINPADFSDIKSPVINDDGSVTFNYEISAEKLDGQKLCLMGELTDWDDGMEMTDDDGDGVYSITIPNVKPGKYQYKFKYGSNWVIDPLNKQFAGDNSLLVVEGFLINCENPAGTGEFEVTGIVTDSVKEDSIEWSVKNEEGKDNVTGITIEKDDDDPTKATITTTKDAKTGYFTVVADYEDDNKGEKQAELELYYTEKAFLYEYEYKTDSENTGKSDIYTWYNSKAGNVGAKFRLVNKKYTAYITLDDSTKSFGYIVRLFGEWGADESTDREFKDRSLAPYEADRYTKVKGGEGIEVPYLLPSAKTAYKNGILFAWRDDDKFYNNTMDELEDTPVKVVITSPSGTVSENSMTYDAQDELFTYHYTNIPEDGIYQFYFEVDGEKVDDQYWDGEIEYKKPELEIKATVTPEEVNYNQNPVVSFDIKDKDTGDDMEVSSIEADLTELGYEDQKVFFQPASKEGVLYVDSSVEAGTYQVPFTITDLWGNETKLDVEVKVVNRTDSDAAWDESRIYFLLTDRFVNGDTSNDYDCAKDKIEAYHGGDFKGLTSKLGYLQELGINTIWITPIVDNIDDVTNEELHQQGYHGYWAKDFTAVDEHLGNTADLDNLIDEAAKRGIKIMVDIVVNHAGYGTEETFKGLVRTKEEEVEGDVILGSLDNLPDFKTEDAQVRAKLIEWQTAWANHTTANGNRIAYFRVDTVKHVDHETWQDLKTSLAKVNPAFKMIGEYFGAGVSNTGDYLGNGQMDALLDFDFKSTARDFVYGKIDSVEANLENRNSRLSNSQTFGQFLSSHDEDGFLYNLNNDTAKMKVAAALQMTAKGTPIVYYGEEINLTGPNAFGDQKNNRYDMQFDNLTDEQQEMLNHYKKLLAARAMYSNVFARGTRTKLAGSDVDGYLVFKRSAGSENVYVGLNTTGTAKTVTFNVAENEGVVDVYSGEELTVSGNSVTVTIPANQDGGTVIVAKGKTLTDVIFQGPNKTAYKVGEELNLDGLTVTGVYGTVKVPISAYTVDASAYNKDKEGTYTIKVTYGTYSQSYQVTVSKTEGEKPITPDPGQTTPTPTPQPEKPADVKVSKISISGISKKIAAGKKIQLTAKVTPANATNKAVTWKTSNKKYATVNSKGKVTLKKAGIGKTVTITATAKDGSNKKATYKIKIMKHAVKSVKIKAPAKTVKAGKTLKLKATVTTTGKSVNKTLKWTSSNTKYATVSSKGVVKTKKAGKGKSVTITVTSTDGTNKKAKVKIKIQK
ncbi:MAG: hypothetical protein HDR22_03210 [Lachnospiraceae bacterium]|nr:hypothetical protein [Lachnospiraceae bacterium]